MQTLKMGKTRSGQTNKKTTRVESSGRVGRRLMSSGHFMPTGKATTQPVSQVRVRDEREIGYQSNSYSVEQILQMGKDNFFEITSLKEPVPIPDLGFSEEEKRAIDKMMTGKGE